MSYGIRRNDQVIVTAGKDRGKTGRVTRVQSAKNRVVIEGINIVTRHLGQQNNVRQGGPVQQEAPVHISNVKIICPGCNKSSKIKARFLEDGSKVRICQACSEVLE